MRKTRLVLFEGIPGSGKSTTGQFLARRLAESGISARWWYEEEAGHPVWLFDDPASLQRVLDRLAAGDVAGVIADALDRWRQFAEAQQNAETIVLLDSALFGYLTWTLFPDEVPPAAIRTYLRDVERIIAPLAPCLVYLRQRDVGTSLRRLLDHRGDRIEAFYTGRVETSPYGRRRGLKGFAGLTAFWTDYRDFADDAFAAIAFPKLAIETDTGDWPAYRQQLLAFLNLPLTESERESPGTLACLAGTYRATDGDRAETCRVRLDSGTLVLEGLNRVWPRNRLLPKSGDTFAVESFPFDATFVTDPAGEIVTLTITGPPTAFRPVHDVFQKEPDTQAPSAVS